MCGICGFYGLNDKNLLKKMSSAIKHRGPDDNGIFIDNNIALANQRLSIIDIKGGHQPLSNEEGDIWTTYNGDVFPCQTFGLRLGNIKDHSLKKIFNSDKAIKLRRLLKKKMMPGCTRCCKL